MNFAGAVRYHQMLPFCRQYEQDEGRCYRYQHGSPNISSLPYLRFDLALRCRQGKSGHRRQNSRPVSKIRTWNLPQRAVGVSSWMEKRLLGRSLWAIATDQASVGPC